MTSDIIARLDIQAQPGVKTTIQNIAELETRLGGAELSAKKLDNSLANIDPFASRLTSQQSQMAAFPNLYPELGPELPPKTKVPELDEIDFGKTERGLAGLSSAIGVLGGEAGQVTGTVLNTAASVPGFIDSLDDLKGGIAAMPGQLAATASGFLGVEVAAAPVVIVLAAIAAGLAALAYFGKEAGDEEAERAKEIERAREAQEVYNEALSKTSTEIADEIAVNNERLRQIENQKQAEQELIAPNKNNDILEEFIDPVGSAWKWFSDTVGWTGQVADQATDRLKALNEEEQIVKAETEALTEAMKSQEVAANDARKALFDQVDQVGELRRFEQDALAGTAEENAKRAQELENEKSILQEQIAMLQASGDTSRETQDKLKDLNNELDTLNKETEILSSSAVKAAEAEKSLASAQEAVAKAASEYQQAQQAVADAQTKQAQVEFDAMMELAAAQQAAQAEILAVQQQGVDDYMALLQQQSLDIIAIEEERQRNIAEIARKGERTARRQEEDLQFISAFDTRRQMADDIEDAQLAADEKLQLQRQADIQERQELLTNIQEKTAIKQAELEADLAQKETELMNTIAAGQAEIDTLQQVADEKQKILEEASRKELQLAQQQAQAMINIGSSALQSMMQLQQSAVSAASQIGSIAANIGAMNLNFPNVTNQNNATGIGNSMAGELEAMLAQLMGAMTGGL